MFLKKTWLCVILLVLTIISFNKAQSTTIDNNIRYLAMVVYYEARGEPFIGQVAVAQVVLNRLLDGRFPNTIRGVIAQRNTTMCQFTWVCRVGLRAPKNNEDWQRALFVAEYVYYNYGYIEDYTDGSLFFHRTPRTRHRRDYNVIINNHAFYAEY